MIGALPARTSAPLIGFRAWRATRRGLRSLTSADLWPVGQVVTARCVDGHAAPTPGCRCGLQAVGDLATVRRVIRRLWLWRPGVGDLVVGAVALWGAPGVPVQVGELAGRPGFQYRAPHGAVLALVDSPAARRVGARFGVPVVASEAIEMYAREFGEQLRPAAVASPGSRSQSAAVALVRALALAWAAVCLLVRIGWPVFRFLVRVVWMCCWWLARALLMLTLGLILAALGGPASGRTTR